MRTHRSRLFNRKDESHHDAEQWLAPASWSFTGPWVDSDDQPLIDADLQAGDVKKPKQVRKKGKAGQKLSGLSFVPFLRQKTNWGTPTPHGPLRRLLPSLTSMPSRGSARGAQNPFGNEHTIDANVSVNTVRGMGRGRGRDEGSVSRSRTRSSTPSSTQEAFSPTLAAALSRSASTPTTSKRSPNRRSSGVVQVVPFRDVEVERAKPGELAAPQAQTAARAGLGRGGTGSTEAVDGEDGADARAGGGGCGGDGDGRVAGLAALRRLGKEAAGAIEGGRVAGLPGESGDASRLR